MAYAAAAAAFGFALPSLYWGLGGTTGLATLGGEIEERALAGDRLLLALNWVAFVAKVLGGCLALALVRPWGRRLPHRLLVTTAWVGAGILTLYGSAQIVGVGLVYLDVVSPAEQPSDDVLRWRLFLWEPWFLVWGLLLGAAVRNHQIRRSRHHRSDARGAGTRGRRRTGARAGSRATTRR